MCNQFGATGRAIFLGRQANELQSSFTLFSRPATATGRISHFPGFASSQSIFSLRLDASVLRLKTSHVLLEEYFPAAAVKLRAKYVGWQSGLKIGTEQTTRHSRQRMPGFCA